MKTFYKNTQESIVVCRMLRLDFSHMVLQQCNSNCVIKQQETPKHSSYKKLKNCQSKFVVQTIEVVLNCYHTHSSQQKPSRPVGMKLIFQSQRVKVCISRISHKNQCNDILRKPTRIPKLNIPLADERRINAILSFLLGMRTYCSSFRLTNVFLYRTHCQLVKYWC